MVGQVVAGHYRLYHPVCYFISGIDPCSTHCLLFDSCRSLSACHSNCFFREATFRPWVKVWEYGFVRIMCPVILLSLTVFAGYKFLNEDRFALKTPSERTQDDKFYYPVGTINYIRNQDLRGNLLIHFDWGEYALWNLYPQCKVALDGRYETVYPHLLTREYFDFLYGREKWRAFLEHYPPDMILVKTPSKIYSLLQKEPDLRQVYADSGSVLFKFHNKHLRHAHE